MEWAVKQGRVFAEKENVGNTHDTSLRRIAGAGASGETRRGVFLRLGLWMSGFGFAVGLVFPTMAVVMGVPGELVHRWPFYLVCVAAGLLVGAVNISLAMLVVRKPLERVMRQIAPETRKLELAAAEIATSSQSLASAATQQASSLEQTSSSVAAVNTKALHNAESASGAAGFVGSCRLRFQTVNGSLEGMTEAVRRIDESAERITRVVEVINEIAFKTNVLALNAAVEAARAGAAGAGFAVVATEVRALAGSSADAVAETSKLINESSLRAADGRQRVAEISSAVTTFLEEASRIECFLQQVRSSSDEQAMGIGEITNAMSQIQQATQEIARHAERSALVASRLDAQTTSLGEMFGTLAGLVGASPSGD
jgi:methyl-accepting chemotaxis protein